MPISSELKRFSISLPPALIADLDRLARRRAMHRAHVVREALESWLNTATLAMSAEDASEHFDKLEWQLRRAEEATAYALERVKTSRPAHVPSRARAGRP